MVGTTADLRGFGPRPSLPIKHLLCENRQTAGRIGEDGLGTDGSQTPRRREPNSNHRSRSAHGADGSARSPHSAAVHRLTAARSFTVVVLSRSAGRFWTRVPLSGIAPSTSALSRAMPQATVRGLPPIMGTHTACTAWKAKRVKFVNRPRQNSGSVLGSWLPAAVAQALAL